MQNQIEWALFKDILYHFEFGDLIQQIGVVQEGWDLAEVGAKIVSIDTAEGLFELLESGAVKIAVPILKETLQAPWKGEYCVLFSEFKPHTCFDVIMIPPMYLLKIRP